MIARELVCSLLIKAARVHDNLKRQMTGVILTREVKGGMVVVEINAGRTAAAIFQPASRHFIRNFLDSREEFFLPNPGLVNSSESQSFLDTQRSRRRLMKWRIAVLPALKRSFGRPGPGHVGPETAVLAWRSILLAIPR